MATVDTPILRIGYEESGPAGGVPIILLHGFPDDVRAFDEVVPSLARAGYRCSCRISAGTGKRISAIRTSREPPSRRLSRRTSSTSPTPFGFPRLAVAGFDWGNRASCIAAALHPDRVRAAVLIGGYTIQDTISASQPAAPEREQALWYQWYFNTDRGRAGLAANRRPLCRLLWKLWSPTWRFTDDTFNRTASSFDNPDFVDCVIHSYRHRNLNAAGEPRFVDVERMLARSPRIDVPSIILLGADDGVGGPPAADSPAERAHFSALKARRIVSGAGHFVPREKPDAVSSAILELMASTR